MLLVVKSGCACHAISPVGRGGEGAVSEADDATVGVVEKRSFQHAAANVAAVGSRAIRIARARTEFPGSRDESTLHKKAMRRGSRRYVRCERGFDATSWPPTLGFRFYVTCRPPKKPKKKSASCEQEGASDRCDDQPRYRSSPGTAKRRFAASSSAARTLFQASWARACLRPRPRAPMRSRARARRRTRPKQKAVLRRKARTG